MVSLWLYGAGTGQAWASVRLLANDLKLDKDTIFRNIKKLEKAGYFTIGKGTGRGRYFNIYKLLK
jgi:DNA-binding MarR family transcriptional regulator